MDVLNFYEPVQHTLMERQEFTARLQVTVKFSGKCLLSSFVCFRMFPYEEAPHSEKVLISGKENEALDHKEASCLAQNSVG